MSLLGKVNFVVNYLMALIRYGIVISLVIGNVIQNLGYFIGQNATALILGGLLGNFYTEEKKTGRHARDAVARLEDDVHSATQMISQLKEARKEAENKNLSLLHEIDERKNNEAALIQRNDDLNNEMRMKMEEYEAALIQKGMEVDNLKEQLKEKERECEANRQKLEELRSQASDNDFYCGYLEDKVKAHEAERKKLKQVTTKLEEKLRASQRETPVVLARNGDLEKEREMASAKNSTVNENKNNALDEENKVLKDKIAELDQNVILQSEVAAGNPEVEFGKVTGRLQPAEDSSNEEQEDEECHGENEEEEEDEENEEDEEEEEDEENEEDEEEEEDEENEEDEEEEEDEENEDDEN
ncbi:troponin T, skeletal muscle-like [Macrobrachium rosenbergii]|uniref:troponin T, skeletal muscle-like n=1 Tax=Macrobrachium rosenbergii TaxID=79674 RepID=UPI0034D40BB4